MDILSPMTIEKNFSLENERKVKSSVMIHESVWKEIRILAIRENKEIGELVEEVFLERLERGYQPQPKPKSEYQLIQEQFNKENLQGQLARQQQRQQKEQYKHQLSKEKEKPKALKPKAA